MRWCNEQTNTICKPKRIRLFALIINCAMIMKTKSRFSRNVYEISDSIWCDTHLRHTATENILTMGKVDTSDLVMTVTRAINISFQSPKLKWASWTHATPYILIFSNLSLLLLSLLLSLLCLYFWYDIYEYMTTLSVCFIITFVIAFCFHCTTAAA